MCSRKISLLEEHNPASTGFSNLINLSGYFVCIFLFVILVHIPFLRIELHSIVFVTTLVF